MPHLTLEYSRNLGLFSPRRALRAINEAMFDSGLFSEPDIKSRAIPFDTVQIGVKTALRGFVHLRIALLAGRSEEERRQLAEAGLAALRETLEPPLGWEVQLSVETVELDRPSYAKAVLHGD